MTTVAFAQNKCVKCDTCRVVCPLALITGTDNTGCPAVPQENQERCIACGHCEAVCPENVITVTGPNLQAPLSAKEQPAIAAEQLSCYLQKRRSIRAFKKEAVAHGTLERIFDAVRYAPTGVNAQTVRWAVVENAQNVQVLAELTIRWMRGIIASDSQMAQRMNMSALVAQWDKGVDRICRNAPHLALAYSHKENRLGPLDCHIALAHLEVAAPAFGLGACWAGYFGVAAGLMPDIGAALGIPQDHAIHGAMMFGYPKYRYARVPKRNAAVIVWK